MAGGGLTELWVVDVCPRWPLGDVQTEEPAHSHPFQETKSTAIRWVLGELMKEMEACVKAALKGRNAGTLVP